MGGLPPSSSRRRSTSRSSSAWWGALASHHSWLQRLGLWPGPPGRGWTGGRHRAWGRGSKAQLAPSTSSGQGRTVGGSRPGSRTAAGGSADEPTMMWTRPTASLSPSRRRVETVWVHLALVLNGLAVGFAELQRGWRPRGSGTRPALVEQVWSSSRWTGRAAALRGAGGEHARLLLGHHAEAAQA